MSDRRYQITCLLLAAVALLVVRFPRFAFRGSAGLDGLIQRQRDKIVPVRSQVKRDVMIEFPILVLGGFRGPLVMGLWMRAEEEKNNQQWWNVKTYHEIIAHLQPNFPSVYVFNAWNLAFNLSVQWHELESKYLWALDGARYAQRGIWINPDSTDIVAQLSEIYGRKLAKAIPERLSFRQRFRADTVRVAKLVEKLSAEERKDLANSEALSERDKTALLIVAREDAMELVPIDLAEYPYGVSPSYFDYTYLTMTQQMGSHSIVGDRTMHSRPAVALMGWAREEMVTAVGWVDRMVSPSDLGKAIRGNLILPISTGKTEPKVGSERWKQLKDRSLFHFEESERRFSEAIEGFKEHLEKYPKDVSTHQKHIYMCTYQRAITRGRKNLFLGLCDVIENEGKLSVGSVGFEYLLAAVHDFEAAIGEELNDGTYPADSVRGFQLQHFPKMPEDRDYNKSQRDDYEGLIDELRWKIGQIHLMGKAINAEQPVEADMSLLRLYETETFY